ncbi:hypothetical protein B0H13DRAFT_2574080 [Mycena leptocephala]|nr:hypothetical protein B0H13DRAFT_2574080 [Mycena leptocephala]
MKSFAGILFPLSLITLTAAHGWVGKLTIAGKPYTGNEPIEQVPHSTPSAIHQIANNLPVKDTTLAELTCGRTAAPAALVATAKVGNTLLLNWDTLSGNWFHDAKWFKIDEQGQDVSGNWVQAKLDDGSPAQVTLPANLKASNYLLRHEIIALHTAQSPSTPPHQASTYKPTDAGILIDVYNMARKAYKFPGLAVVFVKGGSVPADPPAMTTAKGAGTTTMHTTAAPAMTSAAASSPTASTPPPKTCKNKCSRRRSSASVSVEVEERAEIVQPRSEIEQADVEARRLRVGVHVRHLHRFAGIRSEVLVQDRKTTRLPPLLLTHTYDNTNSHTTPNQHTHSITHSD